MIEMFIDNTPLVLPTDLKIRVEINSPAFETDVIPASIVYYFDLPVYPNEESFHYANYVEVKNKYREYNWKMRYEGFWIFSGKLIVTNIGNEFRCAASIKQLPTDLGEKNITDFQYDKINLGDKTMTNYINDVRSSSKNILAFPQIYIPNLYGENNASNPDWGYIVNTDKIENTIANWYSVIPFFHVIYILESIFKTEGYKLNVSNNRSLENLLVFNNHTLDQHSDKFYIFSNFSGVSQIKLNPTTDESGCIKDGKYQVKQGGEYKITTLLEVKFTTQEGFMRYWYFQYKITSSSGESQKKIFKALWDYYNENQIYVLVDGTFDLRLSKGDSLDLTLDANLLDVEPGLSTDSPFIITKGIIEIERVLGSGETEGKSDKNNYAKEINPVNHLPEIGLSDFLLSIKLLVGLTYFFDFTNKIIQIIGIKELLISKTLDLTEQFIEKSMNIEITEPKSFELKYEADELATLEYTDEGTYISLDAAPAPVREKLFIKIQNINSYFESKLVDNSLQWIRLGDTYKKIKTNKFTKKESVDIKVLPVSMTEYNNSIYPFYNEPGISTMFLPGTSKIDKLMYMLKTTSSTASTSNRMYHGGSWNLFSFDMEEQDGVYNLHLKPWYDFISTANTYTCDFKVTIEDVFRILELFNPQDAIITEQTRRVRVLNQNYVPVQFTFEFSHNNIVCQAKLMKNDE